MHRMHFIVGRRKFKLALVDVNRADRRLRLAYTSVRWVDSIKLLFAAAGAAAGASRESISEQQPIIID